MQSNAPIKEDLAICGYNFVMVDDHKTRQIYR